MVEVNVCFSRKELEAGGISENGKLNSARLKFLLINQIMGSMSIKQIRDIEGDIVVKAVINMDTLFV